MPSHRATHTELLTPQTRLRTAHILSGLVALLMILQSAGGLFFPSRYRDNAFVLSAWKGNDLVTLAVAVPVLIAALIFARRGSARARLIWLGGLDYALYNYAFYLFGSAFNAFFLVYVVLFVLAIFALIFGFAHLDVNRIGTQARAGMPVPWIGGYFLFVASGLGAVYLVLSLSFVFTGQLPAIITMTGRPTSIAFALDLTLLAPWLVPGAVWLMKRQAWGYVITGILGVKGPLYTLVLAVSSLAAMNAGIGSAATELPLWVTPTVMGSLASALFYLNVQE